MHNLPGFLPLDPGQELSRGSVASRMARQAIKVHREAQHRLGCGDAKV